MNLDNVPLRANMYYSEGEHAITVHQHTTVNVAQEVPKDHIIWSLLCFLNYNPCCMGLAALIHSIKARDRKVLGDMEGARRHGSCAQTLNIISTVFFCLSFISIIIVLATMFSQIAQFIHLRIVIGSSYGGYSEGYNG